MTIKKYTLEDTSTQKVSEPMAVYYQSKQTVSINCYVPTPTELTSIRNGKEQIARGEFYTQEEVDKMMNEWLN